MTPLKLIENATKITDRIALVDSQGDYAYLELLDSSACIAAAVLNGRNDLLEARIGFMVSPGFEYAATQWGIWRAGGVAVPLGVQHRSSDLETVIQAAQIRSIVAQPAYEGRLRPIANERCLNLFTTFEARSCSVVPFPPVDARRRALLLYGAPPIDPSQRLNLSHEDILLRVETIIDKLGWSPEDRLLNLLPLEQSYGIIDGLTCALRVGASCEFLNETDPISVWNRISDGGITRLMAEPPMFDQLIETWEAAEPEFQKYGSQQAHLIRHMSSGGAPLSETTRAKWKDITGHTVQED